LTEVYLYKTGKYMKRYKFNNTIAVASIALLPALIFSACKKNNTVAPAQTPIATTGVVSIFAGSGASGATNGKGGAASFNTPQGVAVDASGNVYVADQGNNEIRKITSAGVVSTFSGTIAAGFTNTSTIGVPAAFSGPAGVAVDAAGNVYVADFVNNQIREINAATGAVTTLAGGGLTNGTTIGTKSGSANGTGAAALFNGPSGVAVDATGNVYVADFNNNLIREISPVGVVTTLAGSKAGKANGTGTAATFNGPRGVAVDAAGNVYVADANNNLIREISPAGVVTTLAGTGAAGNASGAATASTFHYPSGIAVDAAGNVYVADAVNNLIREISNGTVTSVAGSGYLSITGPFNAPVGVAVDANGVLYVANDNGYVIQKVTH
jgi:streptogramin lyase